jgi:ABC-type polysaccharide/polyol phosphate transport system ATPase subunit
MSISREITTAATENASSEPSDLAIRVRRVTKRYKIYHNIVTGPVKEILMPWRRQDFYKTFLAVDDVSFDIKRGEVVGIIGANGSGKTTLLKLVSGLLFADSGEITVNGTVATLLALSVGIHPEYTGRENIYYSGLLFGMKPDEIRAKMDSIIEFADIGQFIDMPLRTYSSGMQARVLFSLAMSLERDIFIIDEALATGDAAFFAKSQRRIIDLCDSGATVLFVSHSLPQIRELCDRVIVLNKGRIIGDGDPETQIQKYKQTIFSDQIEVARMRAAARRRIADPTENPVVRISEVTLRDGDGHVVYGVKTGQRLIIEVCYESDLRNTPIQFFCGFCLRDSERYVAMIHNHEIISLNNGTMLRESIVINGNGKITITIDPLILMTNHYSLWLLFADMEGRPLAERRGVSPFFVGRESDPVSQDAICLVPASIRHEQAVLG